MRIAHLLVVLACSLCLIYSLTGVFAQYNNKSKKELEDTRRRVESEIEYNNKLLKEISRNKSTSLTQLKLLNNKIASQEKFIKQIDNQLGKLDGEINSKEKSINLNNKEISVLKDHLAKSIRFAYISSLQLNEMNYIFASENFQQAYMRVRYFRELNNGINIRVKKINDLQNKLKTEVESLELIKNEKLSLKNEKESEKEKLDKDKQTKNKTVKECTKKEKAIRKEIETNKANMAKIKAAIDKIIADEIRKAQEAAARAKKASGEEDAKATASKTKSASPNEIPLTPEEKALSSDFTSNKGRLPWPTEKGIITGTFGIQKHKDLPGIQTDNKGIDILTTEGSYARAVYKGVVKSVKNIPQFGNIVIVQHGDYFTVYAKLGNVEVGVGDKVGIKQNIGKILTDDERKTELHFQVWKGKVIENPSFWIAK